VGGDVYKHNMNLCIPRAETENTGS